MSTLLISVGGTAGPVIFSIRQHQAERVIFFVSPGSRAMVTKEILPALLRNPGKLPDHEFAVTPDEQDLGESVFALLRQVPEALDRLGAGTQEWPDLVDYTAGTKTMSAALILASSKHPCRVSYIGTPDLSGRTREGLGVVIDGKERVFRQENPWNRIAWLELRSAAELFNRGQYGNAAQAMHELPNRVDEELARRLYSVLADIFSGFFYWDVFDHNKAQALLNKNLSSLRDLAQSNQSFISKLKEFAEQVGELVEVLNRIKPGQLTWELIHDLLANALRRAELEQKYEDATARCYAAVERIAQHQLLYRHGIKASNALPEQIPPRFRQEFVRRFQQIQGGTGKTIIRFGAIQAFEILMELGDPVGLHYSEIQRDLRSHLNERNQSILAHGFTPMDEPKFRALFNDALALLGARESDLWRFPRLEV